MKFLKENWMTILLSLFLIVVGILLLINPSSFGIIIIKAIGILLIIFGIFDIIKYFRTEPAEASKGSSFAFGTMMITLGLFCILGSQWFVDVFPILAVLYGLLQILIGFRKLQRTVDALRLKTPMWYLRAISAGITLLFGFLIAFNPYMTFISIWVFTALTMVIEGVFDAVILIMMLKQNKGARTDAPAAVPAEKAPAEQTQPEQTQA